MLIKSVLEMHGMARSPLGIRDVLGDAYLVNNNPIFSNIRKEARALGYQFSPQRNILYETYPLSQLENIIKKKSFPYVNNVAVVRHLERHSPRTFNWKEISGIKANYIFHESAHGVARSHRVSAVSGRTSLRGQARKNQEILFQLLEESYANACECLANIHCGNAIHRIFLSKNVYFFRPDGGKMVKKAIRLLGLRTVFKLLVLGFLHANFLYTKVSLSRIKLVLSWIKKSDDENFKKTDFTKRDWQLIQRVFSVGLELSVGFRVQTASFTFRFYGHRENLQKLLDFDFLTLMDSHVMDLLNRLSDIAVS